MSAVGLAWAPAEDGAGGGWDVRRHQQANGACTPAPLPPPLLPHTRCATLRLHVMRAFVCAGLG